jgi:hypothetical protein
MAGPAEQVAASFAQATQYASNATGMLTGFTEALNGTLYSPPTFTTSWNSIAPPPMEPVQAAPQNPVIEFTAPDGMPEALSETITEIEVDTFSETAPPLSLPPAPVISYGAVPVVPDVGVVGSAEE